MLPCTFNVSDIDIGRLAGESRRGVKEDFMHNYMIYIDGQQYESWHWYQANRSLPEMGNGSVFHERKIKMKM